VLVVEAVDDDQEIDDVAEAAPASARVEQMVPASLPQDAMVALEISSLKVEVTVGRVNGGSEANPLLMSQVGTGELLGALSATLTEFGLSSTAASPRYKLDANLLSLAQPMMRLDMSITSTVLYRLEDTKRNAVVFEQHVVMPFTATFGDAFAGVERLKLVNEGSIRRNLEMAVSEMVRKVGTPPPAGTPAPSVAPTS
jgi:hypothetical protein